MTTEGRFSDQATEDAFAWLIEPNSMQVGMLESAMRNYSDPVYDPSDVAKHLRRALNAPMAGFKGDVSKVQIIVLAVAIINYAAENSWDVVSEAVGGNEND